MNNNVGNKYYDIWKLKKKKTQTKQTKKKR